MESILRHLVFQNGQARLEGQAHLRAEIVARMILQGDYTIEEVMAFFRLTESDVYAALTHYFESQAQLDAADTELLTEMRENAMTLDKLKATIASRHVSE